MTNTNYYASRSPDDPYFANRRLDPYRSTTALDSFLAERGFFDALRTRSLVADVACGTGSETAYLATKYPHLQFIGIDLEHDFVEAARSRHSDLPNLRFEQGDLYTLNATRHWKDVQAVWFSQTLSWLPWWRTELMSLLGPKVDRIGLSTLAWDGPIESEVIHYLGSRESPDTKRVNYNVYSIPMLRRFMTTRGFDVQHIEEFAIDIDLGMPSGDEAGGLGSYTVESTGGRRLTFSSWQYLPWHFLMFAREPGMA